MLKGKRLSAVQNLGLQILTIIDQFKESRQEFEAARESMRQALLTRNPDLARGLYPQFFDPIEEIQDPEGERFNDPEVMQDFTSVKWEMPSAMDQEERETLARLLGDDSITVSGPLDPTEGVRGPEGDFEPGQIDSEWN